MTDAMTDSESASALKARYDALYARWRADGERLYEMLQRLREMRRQELGEGRQDGRDAKRSLGTGAREAA